MHRTRLLILGLLGLAGCVAPASEAPTPVHSARPTPATGLGGLMGTTERRLVAQLGRPDLELSEGPTRKIQFLGPECVLDAYLRPARSGAEPVVIHVDARQPDGREMDGASCLAALSARPRAR